MISDEEFELLVNNLQRLKTRSEASNRSECWKTADELLPLLNRSSESMTGGQLDEALCARFLKQKEDCPIRPAYYPNEDTCRRLWGCVANVGPGPGWEKLRHKITTNPRPLEQDQLGASAPIFFLSHALEDHHFAARVRLSLIKKGIHSWLAEGDLHEGDNLFEAVEAALKRCDAMLILISSLSISSAWLYTEVRTGLEADKKILAVVDASDTPILDFLKGWIAEHEKRLLGGKPENWLYTDKGIETTSAILDRYIRVARPSPTRILKFRQAIGYTLNSLTMAGCVAVYPDRPLYWDGPSSCVGFADGLNFINLKRE